MLKTDWFNWVETFMLVGAMVDLLRSFMFWPTNLRPRFLFPSVVLVTYGILAQKSLNFELCDIVFNNDIDNTLHTTFPQWLQFSFSLVMDIPITMSASHCYPEDVIY
jgi:hypothetical protein